MLILSHVHKAYQMGDNVIHALQDVNLTIESGDFVSIMGPSGSGKSTLMHVLGLLDVPDSGTYTIAGLEVSQQSEDELAVLRRGVIGFIFQQFNLLPRISAAENVAIPLLYSQGSMPLERARVLLQQVGLGNRLEHHSNEMSGGQQQRVAIARALINQPKIIFADEPTGNLDSSSEKEIMQVLSDLNKQGITIVIVTHEESIGQQTKRIIRMLDGAIVSDERLAPIDNTHLKMAELSTTAEPAQVQSKFKQLLLHFNLGLRNLLINKVRTALSMLGILIGVGAVVAMLALGRGAQNAIEDQLASLGSNLLVLRPGAVRIGGAAVQEEVGKVTRLTFEDSLALREVPLVRETAAIVDGHVQVVYLNRNWHTSILGVTTAYPRMHNANPVAGRFFTDEENLTRSRVAILGATVIREIFGDRNPLGEFIKINRVSFQVIGVLPTKGHAGPQDQDNRVIVPLNTAMRRLLGKNYVDIIEIEAVSPEAVAKVEDVVIQVMNARHHVRENDLDSSFQLRNMAEVQAAMASSATTMAVLLAFIAAISLLVGGIGIMNIMLVSVTERTREIGLRKAVGAKRSDILTQFLVEAIVISVMGGVLGIVLAWVSTVVLTTITGWPTAISFLSVALAFLFSTAVGLVFGIYPARKASKLPPIEALRYE